jgi:hypothetical protein
VRVRAVNRSAQHGVHHCACCSEPPTSSPTTQIAVFVDFKGKIIALSRSIVPNFTWRARLSHVVSSTDVPASALDGGSWALGASHACMCSWTAVLPGCVLCSCLRCACLCTHLWSGKRSFAREELICVCPTCKRCTAGCLGTKSDTVRAHFGPMTSFMAYLKPCGP